MGIFERIREPKSPPGVAPPEAALRAGALDFSAELDEFPESSRRNCSLFIVATQDTSNWDQVKLDFVWAK